MLEAACGLALFAIGLISLAHSHDDDFGVRGTLQERRRYFTERDLQRLWAIGITLIWLGVGVFAEGMASLARLTP